MITSTSYRWRKITDINREYALFELLEGETPILDLGYTDEGVLEISFNFCIANKVLGWEKLFKLLEDGRILAEIDLNS